MLAIASAVCIVVGLVGPNPSCFIHLQVTESPEEADFILAHGTEAISSADASGSALPRSIAELERHLEQAAASQRPPLIIANPGDQST